MNSKEFVVAAAVTKKAERSGFCFALEKGF